LKQIFTFILILICCVGLDAQSFPAHNHPPQYLETNVDIGPIIMRAGNKSPKWNSQKNRWEFYVDVFNAYNMKFELGINKFTFPNGFDIDKSAINHIIPKYSALSLNQLWDDEDGITTWHKDKKLEIFPDRRESIIFRAKQMNLVQWVEPYLEIILSETFQEIIDEYYPGKSFNKTDAEKLKKLIVNGLKNYMSLSNWNGKLTKTNIKNLMLDFIGNNYSSKLRDIIETPSIENIFKKLDPTASLTWKSVTKKIVNKAVDFVKGPKFWKLIGKKGGEKLVQKGTLAIDAFNVLLKTVDYQTNKDLDLASRIYFKDTPPKITQSAYKDGKITWKYFDKEGDEVLLDIYYRRKNQGNYKKLNYTSIKASDKVHFLNQSLDELSYPTGYPLRIKDIYDRPNINSPLVNGKLRSDVYEFDKREDNNINPLFYTGSFSKSSDKNSPFNFSSLTLTFEERAKFDKVRDKDFLSEGYENNKKNKSNEFYLVWGNAKVYGYDKVMFLGQIIDKSNKYIAGAFVNMNTGKVIQWVAMEKVNSALKVRFAKDFNFSNKYSIFLKN